MKIKYTCAYPLQMTGNANIVMLTCVGFLFCIVLWTNCAIVPLRPCGLAAFARSTKPRRNDARVITCEWVFSRMFIVISVKPSLTDELLKVNSTLKIIFSVIEDQCSGGQRSSKWGRQHFKTTLQLSIVSHAELVLSIIKFSKRVFFSCRSSKNLSNCLLELLHEIKGANRLMLNLSFFGLIHWRSEVIVELQDTASSFGSEGKVLNKFSHSARIHFWLPLSGFHPTWSCTFRTWIGLFAPSWRRAGGQALEALP